MVNLRNTSGYIANAKVLLFTRAVNRVRPHSDKLVTSEGLGARVHSPNEQHIKLNSDEVLKELEDLTYDQFKASKTTINPRQEGRQRKFFLVIVEKMGFRRGPAPHVVTPYQQQPSGCPTEDKTDQARSSSSSRQLQAINRKQIQTSRAKAHTLTKCVSQDSLVSKREADDTLIEAQEKHLKFWALYEQTKKELNECEAQLIKLQALHKNPPKDESWNSHGRRDCELKIIDLMGQESEFFNNYKNSPSWLKFNVAKFLAKEGIPTEGRLQILRKQWRQLKELEPHIRLAYSQATIEAHSSLTLEKINSESRVSKLISALPYFNESSDRKNLQNKLNELLAHIEKISPEIADADQKDHLARRTDAEQILELLLVYLASACKGDEKVAFKVLESLMQRSLTDLVPQPGEQHLRQTLESDCAKDLLAVRNAEELFIRSMVHAPGGVNILKRLVLPGPDLPAGGVSKNQHENLYQALITQRDAVMVYYKSAHALKAQGNDKFSQECLSLAKEAAQQLAHDVTGAHLKGKSRIYFHAVRNGFISFGEDSPFAKANATLTKMVEEWALGEKDVEATKANPSEDKEASRSPLNVWQRRMVSDLAFDVKSPTLELKLNDLLIKACVSIEKILSQAMLHEREIIMTLRAHRNDPTHHQELALTSSNLEALFKTQSLIEKIQKKAILCQRIDTLELYAKDWHQINRNVKKMLYQELTLVGSKEPLISKPDKNTHQASASQKVHPLPQDSVQCLLNKQENQEQSKSSKSTPDWASHGTNSVALGQIDYAKLIESLRSLQSKAPHSFLSNRTKPEDAVCLTIEMLESLSQAFKAVVEQSKTPAVSNLSIKEIQPDQDLKEPPQSIEQSKSLFEVLEEAKEMQSHIDAFLQKGDKFPEEALKEWVCSALTGSDNAPDFGTITMMHSQLYGASLSTVLTGLAGTIPAVLSGGLTWVFRPEFDWTWADVNQIRFGRDASGMSIILGSLKEENIALGASLAGAFSVGQIPALGPVVSHSQSQTNSKFKDGVSIRVPRFDGRKAEELTPEFGSVIETLMKASRLDASNEDKLTPLEALLENHPIVSVTTIENEETITRRASTNAGLFLGPLYPQEVGRSALFASGIFGIQASSIHEEKRHQTNGGAQGYLIQSEGITQGYDVSLSAFFRHGYIQNPDAAFSGARGDLAGLQARLNMRVSNAASGISLIYQPDDSIIGDRYVEYNNFKEFEAAVNKHRAKWIDAGIRFNEWPEKFTDQDKYLHAEHAFNDFIKSAKKSLAANTVVLQENMDVKPEVSARLSILVALEQKSLAANDLDRVKELRDQQDYILSQDSSYKPFQLKVVASSKANRNDGINYAIVKGKTKEANIKRVIEYYPRKHKI